MRRYTFRFFQNLNSIVFLAVVSCSSSGEVVVRSEPTDAQVYIVDPKTGQNALLGQTPVSFSKAERASKDSEVILLRIEKEGYQARSPSVSAFGGGTSFLDIKLMPAGVAKNEIRDSFEKARQHIVMMQRMVVANRYSDALVEVEKVIELDPKNIEAYAAKGSIHYLMKDIESARFAWSKALELNPNYESVRSSLMELNALEAERKPSGVKQ